MVAGDPKTLASLVEGKVELLVNARLGPGT